MKRVKICTVENKSRELIFLTHIHLLLHGQLYAYFLPYLSSKAGTHNKLVDLVLAYPQALIKIPIYMNLLPGIKSIHNTDKVLQLHRNMYCQKQGDRHFFLVASDGMGSKGFRQSKIDECIFYRRCMIILQYVDDLLIFDKDNNKIDKAIIDLNEFLI